MALTVSKERTRNTRRRHKRAGREKSAARNLAQRPGIALTIAVFTWLTLFVALRFTGTQSPLLSAPNREQLLLLISNAFVGIVSLLAVGLLINLTQPGLLRRNSRVILMALICMLSVSCGVLLINGTTLLVPAWVAIVPFALPLALAPILATLLLGAQAGIAIGLLTAITMATYTAHPLPIIVNGVLVTILVSHMARHVRTRSKAAKISFYAGMAQIPVFALLALQVAPEPFRPELFILQAGACVLATLLSTLLALLLLPLLEHVFNITTNISLLEFSDLGHPLLQRLALEAPGTYHHSLVVANVAQAAAEAIGANSLEARISSYFHDIGKLTKPEFFAENIINQANPHDNLSPHMSTLIITSHVKEGLSLAMLHKLPACIHRAIREHHGTSVLQCFHHKAVTEQQEFKLAYPNGRPIDDSQFRYPGPKPSTRISGIICLADAVEAASRCITKPTPANLETLVNDIVDHRIDDGQMDACELSFKELASIKKAFVFTLANMLHGRVPYPQKYENTDQEPSGTDHRQPQDTTADPAGVDAARATA